MAVEVGEASNTCLCDVCVVDCGDVHVSFLLSPLLALYQSLLSHFSCHSLEILFICSPQRRLEILKKRNEVDTEINTVNSDVPENVQ